MKQLLGVDEAAGNFSSINYEVNSAFWATMDVMFPTHYYIGALLERGVRALIYVGANDLLCNWVCRPAVLILEDYRYLFNEHRLRTNALML